MRRIGIIVVHGIGEQKRFEHLEEIACHLYRAARYGPEKRDHPYIQLRRGNQVPHLSEQESWLDSPAIISWRNAQGEDIEITFREVCWADLDMKMSWSQWLKLISWALSVSGVRFFEKCAIGTPEEHGMYLPKKLSWWDQLIVRIELFLTSLAFFFVLATIDVSYGVVTRFGFRAKTLNAVRKLIYEYLGDVKLYQDWFERKESRLEVIGEKTRVAIRRRMLRTIVQTAAEVHKGNLDGYFIFAHSLGTVVAFNGLMETEIAIPNYLTKEEWDNPDYSFLKITAGKGAPQKQMPQRPIWLGKRDAISRAELFKGLKGFLTMGSPLDKFAALWPAIVPVNKQPLPNNVPWLNVADTQDIVAGEIDMFGSKINVAPSDDANKTPCDGGKYDVGGLQLCNIKWTDQCSLFTAHTSYWKANSSIRLIDKIISWLEFPNSQIKLENTYSENTAKTIFVISLILILVILPFALASVMWLTTQFFTPPPDKGQFWPDILALDVFLLAFGIIVVIVFSLIRRFWEQFKFSNK